MSTANAADPDFVSTVVKCRIKLEEPNNNETESSTKSNEETKLSLLTSSLHLLDIDVDKLLFSPEKMQNLRFNPPINSYSDGISHQNPGQGLRMRPLHIEDWGRGLLQVLAQLTSVGNVSESDFKAQFLAMKSSESYFVVVIEDIPLQKVIGSGTLVLERKFIHSAGIRGRVEDVVVSSDYRGRQLGKLLVETLTLLGREMGCYKVSLECKDKLVSFYESFGYKVDAGNNFMVQRFLD